MLQRSPKLTAKIRRARRARMLKRKARYRARLRNGRRCASVEYGSAVIDLLIRLRWLTDRDATDDAKIGAAITRLIDNAAHAAQ